VNKTHSTKTDQKDNGELSRAIGALQAGEHNPIEWTPIIRFVAPILGRIAARYAAKYVANKLGKRIKVKLSAEVAEATADKMIDVMAHIPKSK